MSARKGLDTRAVAAIVAAIAFGAGSFVTAQRTDQVVSDQAQVTGDKTADAKEVADAEMEKVRRQLSYRACRSENLDRANTRLDSRVKEESDRNLNRARLQEPILNCRATAKRLNNPVSLVRSEQRKFVRLVHDNRSPIVRNGKVVGFQPLRK